MNWLAIDTSTERATVAIAANGMTYSDEQSNLRQHAQCLLAMIDGLLTQAALTLNQLDGIVYGCGPGSFTGLRITCSVAKALAYAHDLPLFPVTSLQTIANEVFYQETTLDNSTGVLACLDARMHELYWAYYEPKSKVIPEIRVSAASDIFVPSEASFVLAGVGLDPYIPQLPADIQARAFHQRTIFPNAEAMIRLVQTGAIQAVSAAEALPLYVRNQVT
ncbi:MAG: tRNA (adenosine(37)-N6)-threonylcarbamoyltransferase complex dimerization subunit type 1 TsaB [Legionellaceae bacterium]|nr:tRNA (adenosine(37)-N6)-threonylcarbamoyltransferase complex dimerization subunit type 1 TsaB [Legionellaceae bacterium]